MQTGRTHNPFALSELEPHRTEYVFAAGMQLGDYLQQLDTCGWNAELVGPHGVGKTTLMHTLARVAQQRGRRVMHFKCSDMRPRLPVGWTARLLANRPQLVYLDGGERIARGQLRSLERLCRILRIGLLSTAHATQRTVLQLDVRCSAAQLWQLLSRDPAAQRFLCSPAALATALARSGDSARECLNALYRAYEDQHGNSPLSFA